MGSARRKTSATLRIFREEYRDVKSSLLRETRLTKEDLEVIRRNLVVVEGDESESDSSVPVAPSWVEESEKDGEDVCRRSPYWLAETISDEHVQRSERLPRHS